MRKLEEFVSKERERFSIKDNNIFAFSFGKVTRRWMFLEIIRERYRGASAAFVANSEAMRATYKPGGPHLLTAEQLALQSEGVRLSMAVHLDVEFSISSPRSSWMISHARLKTISGLLVVSRWICTTISRSAWSGMVIPKAC